jgi:hypothetical protein
MPQSNSIGHIVGGAFYGASGGGSTSACIQFGSTMKLLQVMLHLD